MNKTLTYTKNYSNIIYSVFILHYFNVYIIRKLVSNSLVSKYKISKIKSESKWNVIIVLETWNCNTSQNTFVLIKTTGKKTILNQYKENLHALLKIINIAQLQNYQHVQHGWS